MFDNEYVAARAVKLYPFIVAEALELACAIYEDNRELLIGYADYLVDGATEALVENGINPDIIAGLMQKPLTDNGE